MMSKREKVIKGLECCRASYPYPKGCPVCPYEKSCYHDKACDELLSDAFVLLKEQENEIEIPDVSIPEQFRPVMQYDPADDVVACTSCLICGTDVPLRRYESGPRVCSKCKKAVLSVTGHGDRGPDGEPGIRT